MFDKELLGNLPEVQRAIKTHKWDQHENGILLPAAHVVIAGTYSYRVNGGAWSDPQSNLLPTEGLNFMLDLVGNNTAAAAAYIALYANALTPIATHTAATFTATYSEITSGSEGYSESTRVLWDTGAAATATVDNYSAAATFTIVTASSLTVNGVGLLTASAKGATTGALVSASRFGTTRTFANTDVFDVKYRISMTSS